MSFLQLPWPKADEAHHLGLEQEQPADACADIFFLADLKPILQRNGNRGYRAVQLEADAIGGNAKDKSAIFLLAMGKPRKREPQ